MFMPILLTLLEGQILKVIGSLLLGVWMIKFLWNKVLIWLFNHIGERDELKTYLGNGDFESERGWWILGYWISYDKGIKK